MIKKISAICGLILALAGIIGLGYTLDNHWAKATALAASEARINRLDDRMRLRELEPVVWRLETAFQGKTMPPEVKAEYDRVKAEKRAIEKRLGIR